LRNPAKIDGSPFSVSEVEVQTLSGFRGALSIMARPMMKTSVPRIKKQGSKNHEMMGKLKLQLAETVS
jgi:hypothetical protein